MRVTINGMTIEGTEADVMRMYTLINASHNVEVSRTEVTEKPKKKKTTKKEKTTTIQTINNINTYYDEHPNIIEEGDAKKELGNRNIPDGAVATNYKKEYINGMWRIYQTIFVKSKKIDEKTGEEKKIYIRRNDAAKQCANTAIKALNIVKGFEGKLVTFAIPMTDKNGNPLYTRYGNPKSFTAWGFADEKIADKALKALPKFIPAKDIDDMLKVMDEKSEAYRAYKASK